MNKLIAIAIDTYADPYIKDLRNCLNDANVIIDILSKRYCFDDIELYSGSEATTLSSLYNNLYNDLLNAMEEDSILIYFAGHGEYHEALSTSYWLCSDSVRSNVTGWFNMNNLITFFNASKAMHIALISDSCFSGAIFELNRGGGLPALDKRSRQALTSGGVEKVLDGMEDHSLFNLALQKVLNENQNSVMTFNELSERTILKFDSKTNQTPNYGALLNSGHKGGSLIFNLNEVDASTSIKEIQLALEISPEVNIDSDVKLPFFNKNTRFDNSFVNSFVQQLGYSIINDVRVFILTDQEYCIDRSKEFSFELSLSYSIEFYDGHLLSILFNKSDYLGGIHPNHNVYTLNFAFKPDRKLSLYDVVNWKGYPNYKAWMRGMIDRYADVEDREQITGFISDYSIYDLDFSFNHEIFTIYWVNLLPHAFKGYGYLVIPRTEPTINLLGRS